MSGVRAILLHNKDDNTECRKPLQLRSHQHRERVQMNEKCITKVNFTLYVGRASYFTAQKDYNTECRKPLQLRSHQHRERVQMNEKFITKVNFTFYVGRAS